MIETIPNNARVTSLVTLVKVTEEVTHWFSFSFGLMTCGIWVPQLRIEPVPPAMEVQSPNPQTTRGVPAHWLSWRNPQFLLTFTHVFFHKDDLVLFLFFFSPTQIISNALSIKRSSEVNKSHCQYQIWASQVALVVKEPACDVGDMRDVGSIPGSGRSPGEELGDPLQYSCLENPMDRGGWQATVHGVTNSRHNWSNLACTHASVSNNSR